MRYIFNFENREKPIQFNREKLILSALQEAEQLYYMMDTQYEGIYQAEAVERRRLYGCNILREGVEKSKFRFLPGRKTRIMDALDLLEAQRISVFRRGMHFYAEVDYKDLVPGDMLFLSTGDIVPADVRIVFSKNLEVDQSIYTGVAAGVKKTSGYADENVVLDNVTDIPNICFAASAVLNGLARGVVVSTGKATYLHHLLSM